MKILDHHVEGTFTHPMKVLVFTKVEALRLIASLSSQLAKDETQVSPEAHAMRNFFPNDNGGGVDPFTVERDTQGQLKANILAVVKD